MSFKLNEKKIELKKLFTIDSILCVNQKEIELNDNYKSYDVVKLLKIDRNNENKKHEQNDSIVKKTNDEIREGSIKLNSDQRSNANKNSEDFRNDSFSKDDFTSKYNSDLNQTRRYSDDNSKANSLYRIENKHHQESYANLNNNSTNAIFINKKTTDDSNIDNSKKNLIFPTVYTEDLTTKAETLKNFICSTIKNPKLIKDNPFEVNNEAMQCFIQANQQEFQQNNFSNNFQYCFPRIIASSGGQNFNGFPGNSFLNYNQLLSINSGKNLIRVIIQF
jgi:hypothetical protein